MTPYRRAAVSAEEDEPEGSKLEKNTVKQNNLLYTCIFENISLPLKLPSGCVSVRLFMYFKA